MPPCKINQPREVFDKLMLMVTVVTVNDANYYFILFYNIFLQLVLLLGRVVMVVVAKSVSVFFFSSCELCSLCSLALFIVTSGFFVVVVVVDTRCFWH